MSNEVVVLLFAQARESVGRARLSRPVAPSGVPVAEFLTALASDYPKLARVIRGSRIALNGEYVSGAERIVGPGDELAVHPPYSGG